MSNHKIYTFILCDPVLVDLWINLYNVEIRLPIA